MFGHARTAARRLYTGVTMAEKEAQRNPLEEGKGRVDEVDQWKGIFPGGGPHRPGAEPRTPGSLGGGSYQESGRGGVELPGGPAAPAPPRATLGEVSNEPQAEERSESKEPAGSLPQHERGKP